MSRHLRKRSRISYYEPEEPDLDEYIVCSDCADYVYEYCAIHGPLLVIPDDKVSGVSTFPAYVPRAALTIPHVFLHIARSYIPGAGLGIFASLTLPIGVRFGPYQGDIKKFVDSDYCWQIYDTDRKPSHVVDAADPERSNWMRYVNCSRHNSEQNLLAFQYKGHLYYRTTKIVPKNTELLVYYGSEYANRLSINLNLYNTDIEKLKYNTRTNDINITPPKASIKLTTSITNNGDTSKESKITKPNMGTHTEEKRYKCSVCDYFCTSSGDLQKHMRTHTGEKPYKCSVCDYSCTESGTLKTHMRTHTGEKPYKCSVCDYSCTTSGALKYHMRTHTGEKPYKCSVCDYSCTTSGALKYHMRTHTGEKPYKCSVCDYSCTTSGALKYHMRTHTGEKPYKCSVCDYSCTTSGALKYHMRTHTGEKPYKCSVCDYSCILSSTLQRHMRTHTEEKPYKCSVCDYSCTRNGNLRTHMRTHTGEKPYKCSVCDYSCTRSGYLRTHMRTHTGEKPYKCSVCDYSCTQSCTLKKHMRLHTGDKPYNPTLSK